MFRENSESLRVIVLGNKSDLGDRIVANPEEAKDFAEIPNLVFFETSAKDGTNIREAFKVLLSRQRPVPKPTLV
jgi:Ras-related protein Rab-1A